MSRTQNVVGFAVAACLAALPAFAQFDTGAVLGSVFDSSGAVVTGAKVTLENTRTGVLASTVTNAAGNYEFFNVRLGSYRVKAESAGFKVAVAEEFTVAVGARQRVDLTLQVGEASQTVEITGAAAALETDSSDRGQVLGGNTIVNLPLNGRAYADLALLTPGVRKSSISDRESSFNVNGLRSNLNNFMVDGVDNNSYATSNQGYSNQVLQLSPDAVSEFKVVTNNYSAEYGRAGGAIVNASVKSGTNEFHGAAWEYLRNTKLNAVGFFKPALGKPVFQQNQFGGVFGGPIRRNKTFFFADYEGLRRVERSLSIITLPSMEQRAGQFINDSTRAPIPIRNSLTAELYSNGVIPASQITAFARQVFSQLPTPSRPGVVNNYDALPRRPTNDDKGDVRLDQYFSSRVTAFFRYSHREYNQIDTPVIPLPIGANNSQGNVHIVNKQGTGGVTYTVTPTSILEFRMAVGRSIGAKYPLQTGLPNMQDAYGVTGLPTDPRIAGGITTQSISGYQGMGRRGSTPQFQNPLVINPKVNFSRAFTHHTLKAGWELQTIDTDVLDFSPQYGQDNYSGQFARPSGVASNNLYNVADFLLGARSSYQLTNDVSVEILQRMHFYYVQDDWKVSRKLTLNLGARYEYATPQWEAQNRLSSFDPAALSLIFAKSGGIYERALVRPDRNNFAPRIGLAYSLTPRTVIRSGYGVSYIHFNRMGGENLLSYNLPQVISVTIDQVPTNPTCAANIGAINCFRTTMMGYPPGMTAPGKLDTVINRTNYTPPDNRTGYVQSWHFSVQHEVARDLVLEAAYVGNRGVKLLILGDYNQARPNLTGQSLSIQARRPIQTFGDIQQSWGGGFSNYNALQLKLERRFHAGLYLLNSFTWSHAIDNAPGHLEVANGDNSRVNFRNLAADRGTGSYNQPINNTTTLVYDLPYGKGRKFGAQAPGAAQAVFGGWRLTLINTMASGQPINIYYGATTQYSVGYPTLRPNLTGGSLYPSGSQQTYLNFFDKANIAQPTDPAQPFGNAGRNIGRGYPLYQADLGLHKAFPIWKEGRQIEFRSEFFNLLNKTNFGLPNSDRANASFGRITSAFPARVIQFALKLVF
jgi:hypothetical protein